MTKHVPGDLLDAHFKSLGMGMRGGRASAAPTLVSLSVEYISDWIEVVNDREVCFHSVAPIRPMPAAGRCRPVSEHKTIGRLWADEGRLERGIDQIDEQQDVDVGEYGVCDWIEEDHVAGICFMIRCGFDGSPVVDTFIEI